MTEDQIVAKIMKISSDLGLRGHQTTDNIIRCMAEMDLVYGLLKIIYCKPWKFGDYIHVELITEIERILTEKGILS